MKTKADYYEWLMKEHLRVEETMRKIPKLSIEEQSKNVNMVEYDAVNQQKIDTLKVSLLRIENEASRITRTL